MPSERIQRRIDAFLDEADAAASVGRWSDVAEKARAVLAINAEDADARDFLAMAEANLGAASAPEMGPVETGAAVVATAAAPEPPSPGDDRELRRYMPPELLVKLGSTEGAVQGERRRVTILFCDVKGSTTAAQHLDPEEWAEIMNGVFERLIAPVYRYEGTLARLMGDAVLAFFGAPIAHEDDPERAVRAGLAILDEIAPYRHEVKSHWGIDLDVRVGINTGLVVVGAVGSDLRVDYTAMGDAVNIAARMEQSALPGTIQISGQTQQLVDRLFEFESLGPTEVRGRDERVESYRVVRALERPGTTRGIVGLRSPLVGRARELGALRAAANLVFQGQGRIVGVHGEAGVGKSRLVTELRGALDRDGSLGRVRWCEGRALSYQTTVAYTPIRQIVAQLAGVHPDDSAAIIWLRVEQLVRTAVPARVAGIAPYVGALMEAELPNEHADRVAYLQPPRLREAIFAAVLDLLEALARERPLVLAFEDLHWADSASLDLLKEMLDLVERSSILLILICRPNRTDPSWALHEAAGRDHPHLYEVLELAPLDTEQTRELVGSLLAVDGLSERIRTLILEKAEGNPYFVEEVVRWLIDEGVVARTEDRWIAVREVAGITVPDTLSAVLTTRLDQLDEQTRFVAQAASVIGREFRYDELEAVVEDASGLDSGLGELQRRGLVREVERLPQRRYRFKHALLQEAAYETLLLRRRTRIHAAIGDFLERYRPERVEDIADHLLSAGQSERALPFLVAAGERATRSYSLPEAIRRLERALEQLDERSDPAIVRRCLEALGAARELSFDFPSARAAYERLAAEGARRDDAAMRVSGLNKLSLLRGVVFDERLAALDDLAQAEAMARATADGEGLVEACMAQCYLHSGVAEFDDVEYYMNEVTRLGREMGFEEPTLFGMTHLANTLVYLTRFDEALRQSQDALAEAERRGNAKFQAEVLTLALPLCLIQQGDFEAAAAAVERGMEIAARIGDRQTEAIGATFRGKFAMVRGAYEEALSHFQRADAAAEFTGLPHLRALTLCVMGTCYSEIGGAMLERAGEFHRRALATMDQPYGRFLGAWMWSEIGTCALAAGEPAQARTYLKYALEEPTALMHLMRPSALEGSVALALVERRVADARSLFDECDGYVRERAMQDHYPALALLGARVAIAEGALDAALTLLDEAEAAAVRHGMRRLRLDVHASRAGALDALGLSAEATEARVAGRRLIEEIASGFTDDELRDAFVTAALRLVE